MEHNFLENQDYLRPCVHPILHCCYYFLIIYMIGVHRSRSVLYGFQFKPPITLNATLIIL